MAVYRPSDHPDRPTGSAPRSVVRRDNLRHAATAVVVRDEVGRIYAHRRTETKDVYPDCWDFAAGGVLAAGESPIDAAGRELAEELGVTAPLTPICVSDFADDRIRCRAFCYLAIWNGPVRHQPEEVAEGSWLTPERVVEMIADPTRPTMPDTAAVLGPWLVERLADVIEPEQGWDSHTTIVEGRYVDRRPRRPEVAEELRSEVRLMRELAPRLPLAVPRPVVLDEDPLRVRHVLVAGDPVDPSRLGATEGRAIGACLRVLHDQTDLAETATDRGPALVANLATMRDRVLPLLPDDRRDEGARLLDRMSVPLPPHATALVHGDIGPEHLLTLEGRLSGVIDWTDAGRGDPALDFAWLLHGTPAPFADAVRAAYDGPCELFERSGDWRRLSPWWEVLAGLDFLGPDAVESGLAGLLARL